VKRKPCVDMKAMILAAGKGTRLLPLTRSKPKVLVEIQGMSLLEHTIRYLLHFGIHEIIINVHQFASQIIDFLKKNNSFGAHIDISDESDELLDTGGGLYKARWFFDDEKPFVLTSSDVITNINLDEMIRFHQKYKPLATLAVKQRQSTRDFIFDQDYRLCGWHNNTTGEIRMMRQAQKHIHIAFSAIHIINPAFFNFVTERGCFSIIDVYLRLASKNTILGYEHNRSLWFECGRIENIEKLNMMPEIKDIYAEIHSQ
jgi:MurNAc alpha-1-phosphate uridylyltransferase